MDEMLKQAIDFRKKGYAVHWLQPRSKVPLQSGWCDAPVMTIKELEASYRPGYNLGFRPGKWSVVDGQEVTVLDVDIRGGKPFEAEAHAAARQLLGGDLFNTISGSEVGRHSYLLGPIGSSPACAATTLRQSDVWVRNSTGELVAPGTADAKPAWLIELLSTGKNVVLPPSIHPDTLKPYRFV